MSNHYKRIYIIIFIFMLIISSITCNMPGSQSPEASPAPPSDAGDAGETIGIVKEEIISENLDAFVASLETHPETGTLLAFVQEQDYITYVEGGNFSYTNGTQTREIALTNGQNQIILSQTTDADGVQDAFIFDFPNENTLRIWDQNGSVEFVVENDSIELFVKDAAGNLISRENTNLQPATKLVSLVSQASSCKESWANEFLKCMSITETFLFGIGCPAAVMGAVAACATTGWGCLGAKMAIVTACAKPTTCLIQSYDNKPSFEYTTPKVTETYKYCLDNTLIEEKLYEVNVTCKDDRLPLPNNPEPIFITSNSSKTFSCTDCSGTTTSGSVSAPADKIATVCEFGCRDSGDGKAACSTAENPAPLVPDEALTFIIHPGTYTGETTLPELYDFPDKPGEITENQIAITVGEDGVVSGDFSAVRLGTPFAHGIKGDCTLTYDFTIGGTISGILTEEIGELSLNLVHTNALEAEGDCNVESYIDENEGPLTANVSIDGHTITGSVPDLFSFTATKQ